MRRHRVYKLNEPNTFFGIPLADWVAMASAALLSFVILKWFLADFVALFLGLLLGFVVYRLWTTQRHKFPRKWFEHAANWISEGSMYNPRPDPNAHPLVIEEK